MAFILIVEDDVFLRDGLVELLTGEGYAVKAAGSLAEARRMMDAQVQLVVLDNLLPDGTGVEFCAGLRADGITTPVLFLTACDDELQIVRGLDSGADDYVTKPFRLRELLSRIRALLRRSERSAFKSACITLDTGSMTVTQNGEAVTVTPTEFRILSALIRRSGAIVTRQSLLADLWDDAGNFIDDNTLSVHISRLRDKIGASHIVTVRGVGYRWEE